MSSQQVAEELSFSRPEYWGGNQKKILRFESAELMFKYLKRGYLIPFAAS